MCVSEETAEKTPFKHFAENVAYIKLLVKFSKICKLASETAPLSFSLKVRISIGDVLACPDVMAKEMARLH